MPVPRRSHVWRALPLHNAACCVESKVRFWLFTILLKTLAVYLKATLRWGNSQRRQSSPCNAIRQARRQLRIAHKGKGRKTAERVWERSLESRRLEMEGGEVERGERGG